MESAGIAVPAVWIAFAAMAAKAGALGGVHGVGVQVVEAGPAPGLAEAIRAPTRTTEETAT
jgi:hypothetical protein